MSAVMEAREPSATYLSALQPPLVQHYELMATAPGGVARLRELVLMLAVQGKLVPQDAQDEPASELLEEIRAEKDRLIAEGKFKREKPLPEIANEEIPFSLPEGWEWVRLPAIYFSISPSGSKLLSSEVLSEGKHPVVDQGQRPIAGFTNKSALLIDIPGPVVVFGDHTKEVKYVDFSFVAGADGTKILRPILQDERFFAWQLRSFRLEDRGYARHFKVLNSCLFALPPLAEQSRIVARIEELMRLCNALEAKGQLEAAQHAQLVQTLLGALTASSTPEELADNWQRVATHFDLLLDRPEAIDALEQTILQLAVRGLLVQQDPGDEPAAKLLKRIQTSRYVKRRIVVPDEDLIDSIEVQLPTGWAWAVVDQLSADAEYAITDGPFGANLKTEHYIAAKGYRVVRLQNIGYGEFREEHHAYIDKERFERLQKHQVFSGDLLVAGLVDESIRCCRVPESLGPAIVKADCYRFAVHEAMHAGYVDLYLGSSIAHEFAAVHHHGLTLTRIGLGNFRSIPVPIPPHAEQVRIVARVESLRRLCADLRQRLAARQTTQARLAEALIDEVV